MIWFCVDTSSALTGSSSTISFGVNASAEAMAMRCRWPPENWCGCRPRCSSDSETSFSSSMALALRSSAFILVWTRSGSVTISSTVIDGLSEEYGSWNTAWIWPRMSEG
jgi:hypothetical protein